MDWSSCPSDILLLIFKLLDHKSLVSCFFTCKLWRDLVDYIGKVKNIWPNLAELAMCNRGITFKQKSVLPWRDLYFNSVLWNNRNIHFKVDKIIEIDFWYILKDMHIFEDNLIVILNSVVRHYKVDTLSEIYEEKNVIDYQQNHLISGKLRDENNMTLKYGTFEITFDSNSHKFMLVEDYCFIIDSENILFRIINSSNEKMFTNMMIGSCDTFGPICCANIYNDDEKYIYVLTRNGHLRRLDNLQFDVEIITTISSRHFYNSPSVTHMFLKHSVVYSVRSENGLKSMDICEIGDTGEIIVESFGLTCANSHGDLLFLGYQDGEVCVYLAKKMLSSKEPHFKFNFRDMVNSTLEDIAIRAIEVYEAKESHYLFIATRFELVKIILTHE